MSDPTIIWEPQPKQRLFLTCPYQDVGFGGAAGGGKTDGAIGKALAHIQAYPGRAHVLILRKAIGHFREILKRTKVLLSPVLGLRAYSREEHTWNFPDGCTLQLGYLDHDDDLEQYQGGEWTLIIFEELEHWDSPYAWNWMLSRLRSPHPDMLLQRCATFNPGGAGGHWIKAEFIDPAPYGKMHKIPIEMPDGTTEYRTRVFIPSRVQDNKYLGRDYIATLAALPPVQRAQLLYGDWSAVEGKFFTTWNPDVHIIPAHPIPDSWDRRWMAYDHGTTDPYSCGWYVKDPYGCIHRFDEDYGLKLGSTSGEGCGKSPAEIAQIIKSHERDQNWIYDERWADGSIFDRHGGPTIAEQFANEGIRFRPSYKAGKKDACLLARSMLDVVNGKPKFVVHDNCRHFIRTIPELRTDKRPGKSEQFGAGEDHCGDEWLYALRRALRFMGPGQEHRNSELYLRNLKRHQRYLDINQM